MLQRLEVLTNVAVLVVAVIVGLVLVRGHLSHTRDDPTQLRVGEKVSLTNVAWRPGQRAALLVLSTTCRYCVASVPFYKSLLTRAQSAGVRVVAVFPQSSDEVKKFSSEHGVVLPEIVIANPGALGVRGTPTLLLVDDTGEVEELWVGQIPDAEHSRVLASVSSGL